MILANLIEIMLLKQTITSLRMLTLINHAAIFTITSNSTEVLHYTILFNLRDFTIIFISQFYLDRGLFFRMF